MLTVGKHLGFCLPQACTAYGLIALHGQKSSATPQTLIGVNGAKAPDVKVPGYIPDVNEEIVIY